MQYEQGEAGTDEAEKVKDLKTVIHVNKAACYDKEGKVRVQGPHARVTLLPVDTSSLPQVTNFSCLIACLV